MASEIKLTKLKEGVDTVEVTELLVSPGDTVEKDQPLIAVNADKATMEVRSPVAGKVVGLKVKVGDELKVGAAYVTIEAANGEAPAEKAPAEKAAAGPPREKSRKAEEDRQDEQTLEATPREVRAVREEVANARPAHARDLPGGVAASPGTRWLARKLGVDLRSLRGSGPKGRVTEEDVKAAYGGGGPVVLGGAAGALPPLPNFEEFGPVQRDPLTRVRKLTAQKMSLSWSLIPHVTQHDQADITDLEAFRKQQEARGLKLTVTAFALKACAIALKQFPTFNSSLDLGNNQLVLKRYYHIGVAVDTKAGLLVPVIRDVDRKGVDELAKELVESAEKARAGKADMSGGTFTITNLGGIGGTGFTPIVNHPEVAILGLSRGRLQPVIKDGAVVPRLILPLSLSYDHRVIDGADAARFTRRVAEMLESPWMMALYS